ncbi:MAG: hypothetical protein M0P26_05095 [Bacteroidales bacterium]|nr:hypothetical protein [Bacteroidales bacterium]
MKAKIILFRLVAVLFLIGWTGCEKEDTSQNIILYDKPLDVIQSHIQGKWKLAYGKGGYAANSIFYDDNYYMEFTADNRVIKTGDNIVYANSTIKWTKVGPYEWVKLSPGKYTDTYLMEFNDRREYPYCYIVDKIYNDTLIIHDNMADAVSYYFNKTK